MSEQPATETVDEIVINSPLVVGDVAIGGIRFPRLTLDHPRFGRVHVLLTIDAAQQLAALLQGVIERIEQHRMQRK